MPTPAILSGQMDPPPIEPVASIDFTTQEYELNLEPTTLDSLLTWISGTQVVEPSGVTMYDQAHSLDGGATYVYPPSIIAGPGLLAEFEALVAAGGFTVVFEFDYLADYTEGFPVLLITDTSRWGYTNGLQFETFSSGSSLFLEAYNNEYFGDSPFADGGRRFRFASTICFPLSGGQFQTGHSVNGTPMDLSDRGAASNYSFNGNPVVITNTGDLTYITSIDTVHLMSVGNDEVNDPSGSEGWWWWPLHVRWRKFELYQARPASVLPSLSVLPLDENELRLTQIYAEVIHDPL